jgi:ComF family protein
MIGKRASKDQFLISDGWQGWANALSCLLFPSPCRVCGGPLRSHCSLLCGDCWDRIRLIGPPLCFRCGIPFPAAESQAFVSQFLCGACRLKEPSFFQARSTGYYDGVLREAVHIFKYGKREELGRHLGRLMAEHFPEEWDPSGIDVLLPVPLHLWRRRERGFNQSRILARVLARSLGSELGGRQLVRCRSTLPQSDLPLGKKFENIEGAFEVRRDREIEGKTILLVDDIFTSGATAEEASKTLLKAGANKVLVYTLARSVLK